MPEYNKLLNYIKEACEKLLKKPHHIHYTNHDIDHSEKIIERLSKLLDDQKVTLKPVEKFILHAACYLHDIGMQCSQPDLLEKAAGIKKGTSFPFTYEPLEKIRAHHHELSYCMIKNPFNPQNGRYENLPDLGLNKVDNLIVEAIAKISKAHSDSDYRSYCKKMDNFIPDGGARMSLLAVLLRLGDALDADRSRCNWDQYWAIHENLPIDSRSHFWKHYWVANVKIEKGRVGLKFAIPSKYGKAKQGIIAMAEKYIRSHSADLEEIWNEFDIRIGINDPECRFDSPEPPKPMPLEVENFFIAYNPNTSAILHIPKKYKNWIKDRCENMDVSKLVDSKDKIILVKMPEIFIPLYTDSPEKENKNQKDIQNAAREEREPINIENMVSKMEYLLIEGQAGSGKTTLLKHLAYSIIHKESVKDLESYLPVLVFLKDLQENVKRMGDINGSTAIAERFLADYFQDMDNGLDIASVKQFCQAGKALFLIDGLDEIEPEARKKAVISLSDLRCDYGCKMVLSGRPHGIDVPVNNRFGDKKVKINNLNMNQVESFIKNWFKYIYSSESGIDARTAEGMIGEIKSHTNISKLLDTPLMLTAICILYHNGRKLPEQRVELYRKFADNLIYKRFDDPEKVNSFLMTMAFNVHNKGVREFGKIDALEIMKSVYSKDQNETDVQYRQRLENKFTAIEQNCGLLKFENGHYEFWHLTFQEFLAARYIVDCKTDYTEEIKDFWNNDWYQEVVELFIGYLSIQSRGWANKLIEEKLNTDDKTPFKCWRLASRSMLDIHKDMRNNDVLDLVRNRLLLILKVEEKPKILVDAGETLGWLGETTRNLEKFVSIEGGKYKLKGLKTADIKPFEISKYPVTNQWFEKFINAKGYENENLHYWTDEGKKWLKHTKTKNPRFWHERKWKCPNSPVVGVCWYEADAFCRWLTSLNDGHVYRLPNEEEWQAAAAGKEGREYPWGKWEKNRCNISETEINKTSPVGIFNKGCTPLGVADLAGNVWEWTRSDYNSEEHLFDFLFDSDIQVLLDKGDYFEAWEESKRKKRNHPVIRGGSWDGDQVYARCSYRYWFVPVLRYFYIGFRCVRTL